MDVDGYYAIEPRTKIEDDKILISFDDGKTWQPIGEIVSNG